MVPARVTRLASAGALGALVLLAAYWIVTILQVLPHSAAFSDFRAYYAAAWVGTHDGWSRIYDATLTAAVALPGGYLPFANPPPLAWLAAPLAALPYAGAQLIWTAGIALLTVASATTVSDGGPKLRVLGAALVLATLPAVVTIAFGQSAAICLAAVAATRILEKHNRQTAGGAVLAIAFLKPETVILLPLQLLLARRFAMLVGFAMAGAVLAAASAASLGVSGIEQWLHAIQLAGRFGGERQWSLDTFLPPAAAWALRLAAIAAAGAVAHFGRRFDRSLAAGVLASMLISPYNSPADFVLVAYCVALLLTARRSMAEGVIGGAAWIATSTMTMSPGVMPVAEIVLLAALCFHSIPSPKRELEADAVQRGIDLPP